MMFPAAVAEIPAANVDKAVAYYVHSLGFTLDWGADFFAEWKTTHAKIVAEPDDRR